VLDGGYLKRLEADLARWRGEGVLTPDIADRLLADARTRAAAPKTTFSTVAATLGAVLFGLGAITLVGANWDALPKLGRMAAALALIWLTFLAALYADRRGNRGMSHALALVGALAMGAAIALVGQTYHIEGTVGALLLPWSVGALLAAIVFTSRSVLALYVILAFLYFFFSRPEHFFFERGANAPGTLEAWGVTYIPLWFAGAFLARRWDSGAGLHLSGLAAVTWIMFLLCDTVWGDSSRDWTAAGAMIAVTGLAAAALSEYLRARNFAHGGARSGAIALSWSVALAFIGAGMTQIGLHDREHALALRMMFAALAIALSVWAINWGDTPGRRAVRGFAVALFAFECFYIYVVLFGGLMDSALFLLGGGAMLLGVAFAVRKLTQRPPAQKASTGAPP
jgi:uncharacterized membrane protein